VGNLDLRCCDNLILMAEIPDNAIDLIYCDILYGTGKNFGDYQDLKPIRSEIESHYIPRIKEMHRILKSTGSIYLQMGTKINHWIRCLLDDVFGYDKFRNEIVWCYIGGGGNTKNFKKEFDIILYYSKSNNYIFNVNDIRIPYNSETLRRKNAKSWQHIKININGKQLGNVWNSINPIKKGNFTKRNNEYVDYPTQKPKALIERIIKASSNEGDLVADFYMGSGTTAVVCKELNRNFIGCDINPKAIEITKARLDAVR